MIMSYKYQLLTFLGVFLISNFINAQHGENNQEYVENKTIELTNDSSYWENASVIYFGANRTGLYNWAAGGMNSLEFHGLADMWFDYRHNKFHWNNFIGMSFGIMKSSYGTFNSTPWWKNDDRLEMTSKFSRRTPHIWDYSILFNFRTQFTYGYFTEDDMNNRNYMDNFLSPIYPILGAGFDIHANEYLTAYISPLTSKSTIVLDDSLSQVGVFGVDAGQKFRIEAGFYANILFRHDSLFNNKNLSFMSDLSVFSNYLNQPGNIDITWEQLITYRISKYFSLTFSGYMIYDHDIMIPRYENDGFTPIYMQRQDGSYYNYYGDDYGNNFYLDEEGFVIKSGAALQFMDYWLLGLSFTFH